MDFLSIFLKLALFICLIAGPIAIFRMKPNISSKAKSRNLLLPMGGYFIFSAIAFEFQECFPLINNGCLSYKFLWLMIINLFFIMGLGWYEILWRQHYKLPSWPLSENLRYGWVSNAVLIISACMTIFLIVSIFSGLSIFQR
ncbi:MAG: hypothetical protein WC989_05320 [Micavibrio sp.]